MKDFYGKKDKPERESVKPLHTRLDKNKKDQVHKNEVNNKQQDLVKKAKELKNISEQKQGLKKSESQVQKHLQKKSLDKISPENRFSQSKEKTTQEKKTSKGKKDQVKEKSNH